MPAINKDKFLADISGSIPDDPQGMPDDPAEETTEMSCGDQLMAAIEAKDPAAIDAALQEAVAKYSTPAV